MQLINGICNDLQMLLRYIIGTKNFVFFTELFALLTASAVFPTRAALYLNHWELSAVRSALLFELCLFWTAINLPANISTSDQRCFNVVDQRWNNVDPTLKMKQNPTSDFQWSATLIQRQCPTLKQRRNNVVQHNVDTTLHQRCCNVVSTSAKLKL